MLKDKSILTHLYSHALKSGCHIIHTPTQKCYRQFLEQEQLYSQMEAIINLCVTSAKQAIQQAKANALISGVIQTTACQENENTWLEQLSELAIYLADFGIDNFLIYSESLERLIPVLQKIREIDDIPVAVFLKPKVLSQHWLDEYTKIAEQYELELLGLQLLNLVFYYVFFL